MRLALRVHQQTRVRLEPLGALGAVVAAQAGQVLGGLGLLEQLQVAGGLEVGLDLVDVAGGMSVERGRWGYGLCRWVAAHRVRLRVFVLVRFAKMPMVEEEAGIYERFSCVHNETQGSRVCPEMPVKW